MMTTLFRLSATSLAVATTLALTACGGGSDGSVFNGQQNRSSMFEPARTSATNAIAVPNQDSSEFTTAAPITDWQNPSESEAVIKDYYTAKTRDSLHTELKETYGDRFETTFRYTTKITKDGTDVTSTYRANDAIDLSRLGNGHQIYTMNETEETNIDGVKYTGDRTSRIQLYQQPNSIVLGRQTLSGVISDGSSSKTLTPTNLRIDQIKGQPFKKPSFADVASAATAVTTASSNVTAAQAAVAAAQQGLAAATTDEAKAAAATTLNAANTQLSAARTILANASADYTKIAKQYDIFYKGLVFGYKGEAFNQNSTATNKGTLEYHINFNTRAGHGQITGLDTGTIALNEANMQTITHQNPDEGISVGGEEIVSKLSMLGFQGVANFVGNSANRPDGTYTLGIFGDYAEEVAGVVTENNVNTVGFGGVKVSETDQ